MTIGLMLVKFHSRRLSNWRVSLSGSFASDISINNRILYRRSQVTFFCPAGTWRNNITITSKQHCDVNSFWNNDVIALCARWEVICLTTDPSCTWSCSQAPKVVLLVLWDSSICLTGKTRRQGSTLSFLAGCPKSHFLGWYRNFLVYWYLKLDNQVVNSTCPKDKLGWIWRANDP